MTKVPEKRNRRSLRLQGYDYSQAGAYFVTICTQDQECLFGEVVDGEMRLSAAGRAVLAEWLKTADIRPYIELDAYVVMPNHFHGIVMITDGRRGTARRAPTTERFGRPVPGSLPTIVRSFKSAATKRINERRGTRGASVWERNYYEHVIRDDESLSRISEYIQTNPLRWELDRENPHANGKDDFDRWLATSTMRLPDATQGSGQ